MTTPLGVGTLLVSREDVGLLAILAREGVLAIGSRRSLPPRVAALLAAIEHAAAAARSEAGTAARDAAAGSGSSTVTVTEAAKELCVSTEFVRRLCRRGTLVAERRGPLWLVDTDSLSSYALSRRAAA